MSGRNNSTEKALKYVMSTRITVNPQVANIMKNNHFLKNFFYKNKVNLIVSKKINNYIYMYSIMYTYHFNTELTLLLLAILWMSVFMIRLLSWRWVRRNCKKHRIKAGAVTERRKRFKYAVVTTTSSADVWKLQNKYRSWYHIQLKSKHEVTTNSRGCKTWIALVFANLFLRKYLVYRLDVVLLSFERTESTKSTVMAMI